MAKDQISLTATNAKLSAYDIAYAGNGVSSTEASKSVGRAVIKAVAEQIQAQNQYGKATVEITGYGTIADITDSATIKIETRDFEVDGIITINDGVLTWGKVLQKVPSIMIETVNSTTVDTNETVQLTAEFLNMNSTTLTWNSSDKNVATVDNSGLVRVVSEIYGATANITATGNGVTSNTITITVQRKTVSKYKSLTVQSSSGVVVLDSSKIVTLYDDNNEKINIPAGFGIAADSATTLAGGIVIEDGSKDVNNQPTLTTGNQYVWVDVPRIKDVVYSEKILAYDLDKLSGETLNQAYAEIEEAMQIYASEYRKSGYSDTYNSKMKTIGNITGTSDYNTEKRKMLKSVFENGGFWVGRFEAGIEVANARTSEVEISANLVPLSRANVAPFNFVSCNQAQALAIRVAPSGYNSSLMFGIQWDLMLKFMDAGTGSSTLWGNHSNSSFKTNDSAQKYRTDLLKYEDYKNKTKSGSVLLTTGATLGVDSNRNSKSNIHDVAGNVAEWTLEFTGMENYPCCDRGGYYNFSGSDYPASCRYFGTTTGTFLSVGFRVALY